MDNSTEDNTKMNEFALSSFSLVAGGVGVYIGEISNYDSREIKVVFIVNDGALSQIMSGNAHFMTQSISFYDHLYHNSIKTNNVKSFNGATGWISSPALIQYNRPTMNSNSMHSNSRWSNSWLVDDCKKAILNWKRHRRRRTCVEKKPYSHSQLLWIYFGLNTANSAFHWEIHLFSLLLSYIVSIQLTHLHRRGCNVELFNQLPGNEFISTRLVGPFPTWEI